MQGEASVWLGGAGEAGGAKPHRRKAALPPGRRAIRDSKPTAPATAPVIAHASTSARVLAQAARHDPIELRGEPRAILRRDRGRAARDVAGLAPRREQIAHRELAADRVCVELAPAAAERARA